MTSRTRKLILSAVLLALGLVLPFFTAQIQSIGNMLLPMHLPVFLCGLLCGPWFGGAMGFVLPLLRSFVFAMPVLYPNALGMAFELMTYGATVGLIYLLFRKKTLLSVYLSLLPAMLMGRLVWGLAQTILLGIEGNRFAATVFWTNGFLNAIPGIILQLALIPALMFFIQKYQQKNKP